MFIKEMAISHTERFITLNGVMFLRQGLRSQNIIFSVFE
jgi:hypothetical protein